MSDVALTFSYPRLLSAVYFGLLSILAALLIEAYLAYFGVIVLLPLFKSIFLAIIVSAIFGAIFGRLIILSPAPYVHRAFIWGFVMAICALPFHSLGMLLSLMIFNPTLVAGSGIAHYANLYLFTLSYSFLLAGLWIALLSGLAAVILRKYIVYQVIENDS